MLEKIIRKKAKNYLKKFLTSVEKLQLQKLHISIG